MKKTKRFMALVLCLITIFALTACRSAAEPTPAPTAVPTVAAAETTPAAEAQEPVSDNSETITEAPAEEQNDLQTVYPLTVTDMAGRTVTIDKEPSTIVSGYYISSSACIALGLTDKLAAIETGAAKRPLYSLAASQLIDIPNVGSAKAFDLETCLSVNPDLVILPMKQKDTAETLNSMGIPAIIVLPESQEQMVEMITLLGLATNKADRANELIEYITAELSAVSDLVATLTDDLKPVVYMGGTGSYLTTAAGSMYQSSLISAAGAIPAGADIEGSSWTEVSYEQILAINPDIIIVPTNSNANGAPDYTIDDIKSDAQLAAVNAVANDRIYQMTYGFEAWDSPVPSGVLGTLWMLKTLHPELMSEETFVSKVQEFYTTFYGFTPAAESIN